MERFADQICEELNVKKVTLHDPRKGPLLHRLVKPNMKTLGPKFESGLKGVLTAFAGVDGAAILREFDAGRPFELACPGGPATIEPGDVVVSLQASEGWAGVADRDTQVLIDARITDELKLEGMAREVVRQVQELRKQSGLEMEDRIVLSLSTASETLRRAITIHKAYICAETLAVELVDQPIGNGAYTANVKIDGQQLTIELRKASGA